MVNFINIGCLPGDGSFIRPLLHLRRIQNLRTVRHLALGSENLGAILGIGRDIKISDEILFGPYHATCQAQTK